MHQSDLDYVPGYSIIPVPFYFKIWSSIYVCIAVASSVVDRYRAGYGSQSLGIPEKVTRYSFKSNFILPHVPKHYNSSHNQPSCSLSRITNIAPTVSCITSLRSMLAEPSKDTPCMVLAVSSAVAVAAFPVAS